MTQEGFVLSRFESPRSIREMSLAIAWGGCTSLPIIPSLLSCFFLHSVWWPPVNWASGIPLQDEGIRAGVTVESLGKLKACDMQIGRKKNAWNPTARARVLAWWRRAAKCAIPSICPPVMRCINISSFVCVGHVPERHSYSRELLTNLLGPRDGVGRQWHEQMGGLAMKAHICMTSWKYLSAVHTYICRFVMWSMYILIYRNPVSIWKASWHAG